LGAAFLLRRGRHGAFAGGGGVELGSGAVGFLAAGGAAHGLEGAERRAPAAIAAVTAECHAGEQAGEVAAGRGELSAAAFGGAAAGGCALGVAASAGHAPHAAEEAFREAAVAGGDISPSAAVAARWTEGAEVSLLAALVAHRSGKVGGAAEGFRTAAGKCAV